jgi:hypothetical protein
LSRTLLHNFAVNVIYYGYVSKARVFDPAVPQNQAWGGSGVLMAVLGGTGLKREQASARRLLLYEHLVVSEDLSGSTD